MKPRLAHLRIQRVGAHEWEVRVVVADGSWRIATTGNAADAIAIAVDRVEARQKAVVEVTG